MTFRSVSPLLRISILCGGLLAGWSAQATVVSPSGLGFLDLGKTTVDQTTGLEWLDLTETRGRSLQDVMTFLYFKAVEESARGTDFPHPQALWCTQELGAWPCHALPSTWLTLGQTCTEP